VGHDQYSEKTRVVAGTTAASASMRRQGEYNCFHRTKPGIPLRMQGKSSRTSVEDKPHGDKELAREETALVHGARQLR
jgi:hypothetical protein